ncbi:hypothetical protein GZL_08614 [Streptomyces sp. 769]|nr:hypothetical protein GZL_08614 [Streptomyces sp. 769]
MVAWARTHSWGSVDALGIVHVHVPIMDIPFGNPEQ